jgi:glycosyltransferase involved in cell wall biosynthesis
MKAIFKSLSNLFRKLLRTTGNPVMDDRSISIVIPTYNRQDRLIELLESLAGQVGTVDRFEVIVVDDGSSDGTEAVASLTFPYPLRYIRQANQGDAAARNTGARLSRADLLVFFDDDILIAPDFLAQLVEAHSFYPNSIIVGTAHLWLEDAAPSDNTWPEPDCGDRPIIPVHFAEVCSNNMSLRRDAYHAIGGMSNLGFSGSSIWCDVDFSYRAYECGLKFYRNVKAVCWHRDYVSQNLGNRTKREKEAAYRSVVLFQKHPDLLPHIKMFDDKTPIAWGEDPPRLITRKMFRRIASSSPSLWGMEHLVEWLEKSQASPALLNSLYRWVVGGYIFQGYQEGLRAFQVVQE